MNLFDLEYELNRSKLHSVTLQSKSLGKIADDGDGSKGDNKLEITGFRFTCFMEQEEPVGMKDMRKNYCLKLTEDKIMQYKSSKRVSHLSLLPAFERQTYVDIHGKFFRNNPTAPQDTIGPPDCKDALLAHGQPVIHQNSQVLLSRASPQQINPQPVLVLGVIPPQVQDPTLAFVEPHQALPNSAAYQGPPEWEHSLQVYQPFPLPRVALSQLQNPPIKCYNPTLKLTGEVPDDWELANVMPIRKKGRKEDLGNYRLISLTSMLGKIMEQIILSAITQHLQDSQGIRTSQHGFWRGRSCLTNLVSFYDQVPWLVDAGKAVGVVYLDFSKAFDTVSHSILLEKSMAWTGALFAGLRAS
ncbi:hypothetical protein DUI87_25341 [Hirundo rustica rustica]|uniref:Reverse transcriptase domain-containing protein n=1 Tax=Hirundo rustica rustica TaxID=333673 RepID=A0A3M0JFQ0_HIRRU|nr:hypothetical protein DUI87_25341 [Hirundo rustica rustica]